MSSACGVHAFGRFPKERGAVCPVDINRAIEFGDELPTWIQSRHVLCMMGVIDCLVGNGVGSGRGETGTEFLKSLARCSVNLESYNARHACNGGCRARLLHPDTSSGLS